MTLFMAAHGLSMPVCIAPITFLDPQTKAYAYVTDGSWLALADKPAVGSLTGQKAHDLARKSVSLIQETGRCGVVLLDCKPQNMCFNDRGEVAMIDFDTEFCQSIPAEYCDGRLLSILTSLVLFHCLQGWGHECNFNTALLKALKDQMRNSWEQIASLQPQPKLLRVQGDISEGATLQLPLTTKKVVNVLYRMIKLYSRDMSRQTLFMERDRTPSDIQELIERVVQS